MRQANALERWRAPLSTVSMFALVAGWMAPSTAQVAPSANTAEAGPAGKASAPQGQAIASQGGEDPEGTIVVTASRLAASGFTAPTPTTVVNSVEIQRRAPTNIADTLNELPAFRPSTTTANNTITGPNVGQSFADLRGLGSTRTLILVNGRRHVPTTATGQVDLSLIPTQLIDRTEVVTGGASAAWGSDAVAGVVNLILKNKLQGIEGSAQSGITDRGDIPSYKFGLAAGTSFLGDRGHIVVGGEITHSGGIKYTDRGWVNNRAGNVGNTAYLTNGLPAVIYANDIQFSNQVSGGVITGVPNTAAARALLNITFLDNGQLGRLVQGQVFGGNMIGGSNTGLNNYTNFYLVVPVARRNAFSHAEFDVTDKINAFTELSYAYSKASSITVPSRDSGSAAAPTVADTAPIPRGMLYARTANPFMPDALRRQLLGAGLTQVSIGRYNDDIGYTSFTNRSKTLRGVGGLNGELGGSWHWDAYYQYGKNESRLDYSAGRRIESRWVQAVDVVTGPAGTPVCRSTLTNPSDGCVPFNIFGPNASSEAARRYVSTPTFLYTDFTQEVASASVRGDPFNLFAGPLSVVVGGEWRRDKLAQRADGFSSTNQLQFGNVVPTSGSVSVKEAFAEAAIRLFRDLAFAKSFDIDLAGRVTDYSTSGRVTTWKAGATWDIGNQLRVRGTVSRDIRAPNVAELFAAATTSPIILPQNGGVAARQVTGGNVNLQPERAYTYTAGIVLQPSFLPGLRASVDWYRISITGAIAAVGAATIVTRCIQGATIYCPLITRDATGLITDVASQNQNLNGFKTSGVDFELSYTRRLSDLFGGDAPGSISLRSLSTYTYKLATNDGFSVVDRAGALTNGVPKWQNNITLSYMLNRFTGSIQTRFFSGMQIDALAIPGTATSANIYRIPGAAYVNLSASFDLTPLNAGHQVQVFGVVDNLLDKHPPFPIVQNAFYDVIGRAYRIGVRFKY